MEVAALIPIHQIWQARSRVYEVAVRTPLLRLPLEEAPCEIYLKLENLQPIGSFKIRGAYNAMRQLPPEALRKGVLTASAGNMAQGVALAARRLGVPCHVVVPEGAPETKLRAVRRLGGQVIQVPFGTWWETFATRSFPGVDATFVHAFDDDQVMGGNGTIGLEILEDLPDVDAILIPFGGGGLSAGIASAVRALRPGVRIWAVEAQNAAPLAASLAAGRPVTIEHRPSISDGTAGKSVFPRMYELAVRLLDGSFTATEEEIRAAIRLLAERARVVAEGAGALALAVALSGRAGAGKVVCIVSGGNIDLEPLREILA